MRKQAGNIKLDSETILTLVTIVYFKAKWSDEFSKGKPSPKAFHAPGEDVETDFMHQRDSQT